MRVVQLSVFYRNDQPNGFGYTFDLNPDQLTHIWNEVTTQWDAMWRDEPSTSKLQLISLLTNQLEAIVSKPERDRTLQDALLAFGNLYLLEKLDVLHSDDFNGILSIREF